ncbi:MAG: hypothetical protein AABN95_25215 [Acidobacteriota bacterium]
MKVVVYLVAVFIYLAALLYLLLSALGLHSEYELAVILLLKKASAYPELLISFYSFCFYVVVSIPSGESFVAQLRTKSK